MGFIKKEQKQYDSLSNDRLIEKQEIEEAWDKFEKACRTLGEKEIAEFKTKNKKPVLMLITTGSNVSYLVKADARIQTIDNNTYYALRRMSYDNFPPSEPMPLETNPHWYIPTKYRLQEAWMNKDNILLDIADGITTVLLKYEDIEELHFITINSYDDIEELRTLTGDSANNNVILGVYPELQEDIEKWSKE
ncbi:hypothetical protein [Lactococcus phage CHPC971]|uniref:Uncharacterized protein n=1 Tax=Lactococcus phage CHPC971 TaxID=2575255 RepID=A0A4Y5MX77_9CAUD|nr:hypothetical protein KMD16_gp57 [Lactococcus phage CHPC971]QCW07659.1 hypothetical protein [Lactococcus phage CHPC971]